MLMYAGDRPDIAANLFCHRAPYSVRPTATMVLRRSDCRPSGALRYEGLHAPLSSPGKFNP
jgi:hypothetical protein